MPIVIGSLFGDEGKGLMTSYLCSKHNNPIVVRFNGGHQAGHTVVQDGYKHIFSNLGSGTLQNVPTFWSKHCTFEPISFLNEYTSLINNNYKPQLFVHPLCPVTTPYDVRANRDSDANLSHGSVGVGFGKTIQRQENYFKLFAQDLFFPSVLIAKLKNIANYYGMDDRHTKERNHFLNAVEEIKDIIVISRLKALGNYTPIFEGAQGILLDQDFGFFPNVTRSNTTTKNVIEGGHTNEEVFYVTRSYQTRHGNGFMTNEDKPPRLIEDRVNETNVTDEYQGNFRKGILDIDLLNYAYQCDNHFSNGLIKNLVVTCLDQTGDQFYVTTNNEVKLIGVTELTHLLNIKFDKVFVSKGPEISDITRIK